MGEFRSAEARSFLDDDVALVDKPTYAERFTHVAWAWLLRLVRQTTDADGQVLRPAWQTAQATRRGCCQQQASTLVQTFCPRVFKLAGHSKLDDPAAMIAAQRKIEDTITALILEMKGRGGSGGGGVQGAEAAGPPCSADTIPDSEGTPCSSSGQIVRQQRRSLSRGRPAGRWRLTDSTRDWESSSSRDQHGEKEDERRRGLEAIASDARSEQSPDSAPSSSSEGSPPSTAAQGRQRTYERQRGCLSVVVMGTVVVDLQRAGC